MVYCYHHDDDDFNCAQSMEAGTHLAKTSAAIGVTLWYAAERDSATDWSENKKEKISKSDA